MAHFAKLDAQNVVENVIVVSNNELLDNGVESEAKGIAFCKSLFGEDTNWVQTSYNSSFRKHYAMIGGTYDAQLDAFIPVKAYPSFVLNSEKCEWEPPVPYPADGKDYVWDESTLSWVEFVLPTPPSP